jgi:4'-phosphopantetheinyl transferase
MVIQPWQEAELGLEIAAGEIQVWSAQLDMEDSSRFLPLLSTDERSRASRLKSKRIADFQLISRGILRILLGRYLDRKPQLIEIANDQFGKPFFSKPENSQLSFNLAHSDNLALFAFGQEVKIGIDVEKLVETRDFNGISSIVFSQEERQFLTKSRNLVHDFYSFWTAKEAILKAIGRGFAYPSNQFSVVLSRGKVTLTKMPAELSGGFSCSLTSFSPMKGYMAAVAVLQ